MKNSYILDLRFSDPEIEKAYTSLAKQNLMRDFQVTVIVFILVTSTITISGIVNEDSDSIKISGIGIGVLLILYSLRKLLSVHIDYLTLTVIFAYTLYRLINLKYGYDHVLKNNLFFGGYTYAIFQVVFIGKCPHMWQRTIAIVIMFILRFSWMILAIDRKALEAPSILRGAIVDIFVLYYFYMNEKSSRTAFLNLYDNREEIMKFKELLHDSFPQSVTIIDCDTVEPLFSNKAFLMMFGPENLISSPQTEGETDRQALKTMNVRVLDYINALTVDPDTMREIDTLHPQVKSFTFSQTTTTLKQTIERLIKNNLTLDKALSMTASYGIEEQHRLFEVTLKRVKWDRADAIALILNDITYQEKLLTLKLANSNKDKVIATVSHELRTPLNGIIGLLDIAQKQTTKHELQKYISLSKDNTSLLLNLVNTHLDLKQLSAGKLKLNPWKIALHKVLDDVVQLFQFQTSQKNIYLKFLIDKEVSDSIVTDENRLKQILINLIGNAIKFTSSGGITVKVTQDAEDERCLKISVIDTGLGIREEDISNLFQAYGKLEDKEGMNKGGVGLGLTISNALAELLKGNNDPNAKGIEVNSEYGKGSQFSFKILKDLNKTIDIKGESKKDRLYITKQGEKLSLLREATKEDESSPLKGPYESLPTESGDEHLQTHNYPYVEILNENMLNHKKTPQNTPLLGKGKRDEELNKKDYIIVVDDNPFNVLVAKNNIESLGYNIKTASNGKEALAIVKSCVKEGCSIKVIFMDCQMPIMDGYEATAILKEMMRNNEIPSIPILAFTANESEEEIQRCYKCGMEGFLVKPGNQQCISEALDKINNRHKSLNTKKVEIIFEN